MAMAALILGGCQTPPKAEGQSGVMATYSMSTLRADLPHETVPVQSVIAAAQQAMMDRGYTVEEATGTESSGRAIGWPPRYSGWPRMVVEAKAVGDTTRVTVAYEPFGDEALSRALLERILANLGL